MGKIELETLLSKLDFWLLLFGVIVVVGVGGESIFGFRHWLISRRLQDLQRREERELQAQIARLNSDAEEARRDAANANERAAEATRIAEGERLARLKIEEKLAPRRLTDDQKRSLASRLRRFAGQRLNFFAYSGDTEIADLANDVLAALSAKGGAG